MIGYILRTVGLGMKVLFAGGLVYVTYDMGLWGNSDQTEKIYTKTCDTLKPYLYPVVIDEEKSIDEACEAQEEFLCMVKTSFIL